MSSFTTAMVMFGCVLASSAVAMLIALRLPGHHLTGESKDAVKLGLGVIATLTALVLGLLVAAAKGTYDAQTSTVRDAAAQLGQLDRILARYGPEAKDARAQLRKLTQAVLEQLWPHDHARDDFSGGESKVHGEAFFDAVAALQPQTDSQRLLKARAQEMTIGLGQLRQRLVVAGDSSIPTALLVVLGFWQAILFAGFGLLAPRNPTAIGVLVICMISVAMSLFLVLELDRPFDGMIRISDGPVRLVLSHMGE